MILHLTKKLSDRLELGKLPTPADDFDRLYSWRVNITQEDGYEFLVYMNDASRYAVFVNKPDGASSLSDMLFETLRDAMLSDNINPAVVERYISECGEARLYRNLGRKETAWLNKATDNVWFAKRHTDENLTVTRTAAHLSVPPHTGADMKEYYHPDERFYSMLETYGLPIRCGRAFDLNVRLELDGSDAIRNLRVSANITFEQLHRVLQAAFGWTNSHLHSFGMFTEWSEDYYASPDVELVLSEEDLEYKSDAKLTANIKLSDYLPQYTKILYSYDYGDEWRHYIEVENIIENCAEQMPILLCGTGDAPPEDVGGAGGFAEFMRIINDPDDAEYEFNLNWSKSQLWRRFDFERVARIVKHSLNW
jgi:hypothetical protein